VVSLRRWRVDKFVAKSDERRLRNTFGEQVSWVLTSWDVHHVEVAIVDLFSEPEESDVDVLASKA